MRVLQYSCSNKQEEALLKVPENSYFPILLLMDFTKIEVGNSATLQAVHTDSMPLSVGLLLLGG